MSSKSEIAAQRHHQKAQTLPPTLRGLKTSLRELAHTETLTSEERRDLLAVAVEFENDLPGIVSRLRQQMRESDGEETLGG